MYLKFIFFLYFFIDIHVMVAFYYCHAPPRDPGGDWDFGNCGEAINPCLVVYVVMQHFTCSRVPL